MYFTISPKILNIGVIFNGDVSLNVDSLLRNEITDLAGFGKIAESIKEFTKIV